MLSNLNSAYSSSLSMLTLSILANIFFPTNSIYLQQYYPSSPKLSISANTIYPHQYYPSHHYPFPPTHSVQQHYSFLSTLLTVLMLTDLVMFADLIHLHKLIIFANLTNLTDNSFSLILLFFVNSLFKL